LLQRNAIDTGAAVNKLTETFQKSGGFVNAEVVSPVMPGGETKDIEGEISVKPSQEKEENGPP